MSPTQYDPLLDSEAITSDLQTGQPILDQRDYTPMSDFSELKYLTQILVHGLTLAFLLVIWYQPYIFFLWHPTFAVLGLYFYIQGILQVQSTETIPSRVKGLKFHTLLNILGTVSFILAFIIIEVNKFRNGKAHFISYHGKLGLLIVILVTIAAGAGSASVYFPSLFGGRAQAKLVYKPHRILGYSTVAVIGLNIILGVYSGWGLNVLSHHLIWSFVVITLLASLVSTLDTRKLK